MATTSLGSDAAFAIGLLVVSVLVLQLLRHYLPLRSTPAYLLLPVFLALALPASIVLLLPIDLASSATEEDGLPRGIWLPERARLVCWRITYWLIFVLTWAVLPLLGEYSDSGNREPRERVIYSLRRNAKYQLVCLGTGALTLTYVFISSGITFESFKAMVIALPYAWGLILAMYLMGHGLVSFPRRLIRDASTSSRLRHLQTRAPSIREHLTDAEENLQALEAQVLLLRQRKTGTAARFQDWVEDLLDSSDMPESRIATAPASRLPEGTVPVVVTEGYMADLTRKLKRARHARIRFVEEWDRCVREAKQLQDILDASGSRKLAVASTGSAWSNKAMVMTPTMRYYFYARISPALRIFLGIVFAIASVCVAWSEIVSRLVPTRHIDRVSIVGISIIHHPGSEERGKIGFAGQVMAGGWLLYMMTCALTSIREVKIWGNRALVTRHTYSESACWYASQVARLTIPLSYNFMSLVPEIFEKTTFYDFLGTFINLTPLGQGFSDYFPVLIIIPILAATFNLYGKVKSIAGYGGFEDDMENNPNGYGTGGWREGKALIDRELDSANSLGLASRDQASHLASSRQGAGRGDDHTTASLHNYQDVPSSQHATSPADPSNRRPARRSAVPEEDAEEGGFFSDFTHRFRNTIDTIDKPAWLPQLGLQRPKWMDRQQESSGRADSGIGRWFGGRQDDGRVRL